MIHANLVSRVYCTVDDDNNDETNQQVPVFPRLTLSLKCPLGVSWPLSLLVCFLAEGSFNYFGSFPSIFQLSFSLASSLLLWI